LAVCLKTTTSASNNISGEIFDFVPLAGSDEDVRRLPGIGKRRTCNPRSHAFSL
jgi:hypothetical protein